MMAIVATTPSFEGCHLPRFSADDDKRRKIGEEERYDFLRRRDKVDGLRDVGSTDLQLRNIWREDVGTRSSPKDVFDVYKF